MSEKRREIFFMKSGGKVFLSINILNETFDIVPNEFTPMKRQLQKSLETLQ